MQIMKSDFQRNISTAPPPLTNVLAEGGQKRRKRRGCRSSQNELLKKEIEGIRDLVGRKLQRQERVGAEEPLQNGYFKGLKTMPSMCHYFLE